MPRPQDLPADMVVTEDRLIGKLATPIVLAGHRTRRQCRLNAAPSSPLLRTCRRPVLPAEAYHLHLEGSLEGACVVAIISVTCWIRVIQMSVKCMYAQHAHCTKVRRCQNIEVPGSSVYST